MAPGRQAVGGRPPGRARPPGRLQLTFFFKAIFVSDRVQKQGIMCENHQTLALKGESRGRPAHETRDEPVLPQPQAKAQAAQGDRFAHRAGCYRV